MSEPHRKADDESAPRRLNLVLIYTLMAAALLAAIAIAGLIVLPYYRHRS